MLGRNGRREAKKMSERLTLKLLASLILKIIWVLNDREKALKLFSDGHPGMRDLREWATRYTVDK